MFLTGKAYESATTLPSDVRGCCSLRPISMPLEFSSENAILKIEVTERAMSRAPRELEKLGKT